MSRSKLSDPIDERDDIAAGEVVMDPGQGSVVPALRVGQRRVCPEIILRQVGVDRGAAGKVDRAVARVEVQWSHRGGVVFMSNPNGRRSVVCRSGRHRSWPQYTLRDTSVVGQLQRVVEMPFDDGCPAVDVAV